MNRIGLVLEDQPDTRAWMCEVMAAAFPAVPVAEAASLAEAQEWLLRRDGGAAVVALVDLGLPDGSGVEFIRALVAAQPAAVIVVTTIFDDDEHLFDAIAAGAQGYLLKDHDADATVARLRRMEAGEPPLSPSIARRIMEHFRALPPRPGALEPPVALTPRETEVLGLLGRGLRVAETARVLGLADHTVAGYVKAIYLKLSIASRAEAALEAQRRGLV